MKNHAIIVIRLISRIYHTEDAVSVPSFLRCFLEVTFSSDDPDVFKLSASGDSGTSEVVVDPQGEVAKTFQNLGVCVVQQCAKIRQQVSTAVTYDKSIKAIKVKVPALDEEFLLHPATVRRNDRSAQSVDEWTGEQKLQYTNVPEDIEPEDIRPMGNYAVQITWPDEFGSAGSILFYNDKAA
ncbi:hypothetical protein Ancab_029559 [Ancistrocladus abbreviatus]